MWNNLAADENFVTEDDAKLCVDYLRPHLQALIDYAAAKHKSGAGALWALQWGYADLLRQFAGDMTSVDATAGAYLQMPEADREAAKDYKERVQQMLTGARLKGFSTIAMAGFMMAAISNIYRQMAFANEPPKVAQRLADDYKAHLIMAMNNSRRATVN